MLDPSPGRNLIPLDFITVFALSRRMEGGFWAENGRDGDARFNVALPLSPMNEDPMALVPG